MGIHQTLNRETRPISLDLKFGQILFLCVANSWVILLGLTNFQLFFLGLSIFVSHSWILRNHFFAFCILNRSIYLDVILDHSIFLGLNLESFCFFCSWNFFSEELSVKEMLACHPPWENHATVLHEKCIYIISEGVATYFIP